jgi:NAD(P)-dependent dehydrogenase (short-subunit alcohol dehydrogenase family)
VANYLIVGISSDISLSLARRFLDRGARVWGTYRSWSGAIGSLQAQGAVLSFLDVDDSDSVAEFAAKITTSGYFWNRFISAVGILAPIGPFFDADFDAWDRAVRTNSLSQLRVLRSVFAVRDQNELARAILFAGGGTNSPFDNYSAYCLGKIMLIKACELLDSEEKNLSISILGTGWVNTKIHQQTLAAGRTAGGNFDRTRKFIESGSGEGTSLQTVADCIDWCFAAPREAVGGRNFSIVHDNWRDPSFIDDLVRAPSKGMLRRHWPDGT